MFFKNNNNNYNYNNNNNNNLFIYTAEFQYNFMYWNILYPDANLSSINKIVLNSNKILTKIQEKNTIKRWLFHTQYLPSQVPIYNPWVN